MAKAPADQFYYGDWLRDPALQACCASTRGIWINLLSHMWFAEPRGKLTGDHDSLCRLGGCSREEMDTFVDENYVHKFADVTFCNKNVTVINRRMYREDQKRRKTRRRVEKHREQKKAEEECNGQCNADVTPPSSSPKDSSSISKEKEVKEKEILHEQIGRISDSFGIPSDVREAVEREHAKNGKKWENT